jgi:hypothetical protein
MDEVEQRFVVKYFFSKGCNRKNITVEFQRTFRDSALFSSTAKRWVREFKNGDLSYHDNSRLINPSQSSDQSRRSFLIAIHFQAPVLYQDTFVFFF